MGCVEFYLRLVARQRKRLPYFYSEYFLNGSCWSFSIEINCSQTSAKREYVEYIGFGEVEMVLSTYNCSHISQLSSEDARIDCFSRASGRERERACVFVLHSLDSHNYLSIRIQTSFNSVSVRQRILIKQPSRLQWQRLNART